MSSFDHSPDQNNYSPENEAWNTLSRVVSDLRAASETLGENKPLFDEELRRIVSRIEIFRYEPECSIVAPYYDQEDGYLFVPANQQLEGLLVVDAESDALLELHWRVIAELGDSAVFWECSLSDSEHDGFAIALRQSTPPRELVDPEIVRRYLEFSLEYPGDALSAMSPQLSAIVDADPGASVAELTDKEDIGYPVMSITEMKALFYQPE